MRVSYEGISLSGGRTSGNLEAPDGSTFYEQIEAVARGTVRSVAPLSRITGIQGPSQLGDNTFTRVSERQSRTAIYRAIQSPDVALATRAYVAAGAGLNRPDGLTDAQWNAARDAARATQEATLERARAGVARATRPASTPTGAGTGNS